MRRLDWDAIANLHACGFSDRAIGRRLGIDGGVVSRIRGRLGLPALYQRGKFHGERTGAVAGQVPVHCEARVGL